MRHTPGRLTPEQEKFVADVRRELERLEAEKGLPTQDEQDFADLAQLAELDR